jgi:hypothetical protein
MNKLNIKAAIDRMTEDERFFAAAYFQHRAQENDPAYQAVLAERIKSMNAGCLVTLGQVHRVHDVLEAEGL